MSEKPEGNGPPPPLPEIPARSPTPTETTSHTTPLSNGVRLNTMLPTPSPHVGSTMPLVQTAGAPPPPPPPPLPPSDIPTVKIEPATISESGETEFQCGQTRKICRDFIRGSCSRENKCRYSHEYDQKQIRDVLIFCHDFQNKGCNRPNCKFVHATLTEEQIFYKTGKLPKAILDKIRNGEAQSSPQPTNIDLNNLITRPPPTPSTSNTVNCNPRAPTHFNQGIRDVFPPPANLSRPPPTVPKWNYIRPNGRPTIPPPPPTENFIQSPTHNLPPMSYFPPTNQPPPTTVIKDNGWPTPSSQPTIKTDIQATEISIKRTWPDTGDNLNVSQSASPGHKQMRMDFMGSCPNCKLLESRLATANSKIEELLKIILEFEKWQKEAEKQKSLLEHISSIIGSSQTQNSTSLGDNVPNISNTLLNLGLPVASLCTPHTQIPIQSGLDSQQITMQLPTLQLPQLLQLQRNHTSNDQQVRITNSQSIIGNSQNWSDTNLNGQQQNMVSVSYGNNQVMLHMPPGRQLTPQQQQVLQLLDGNGFSISYK